jgi:hypothetical protein
MPLRYCGLLVVLIPFAATAPDESDPFADRVVCFKPGPGAGYGKKMLPKIVLGPPYGRGKRIGGTDVLSLGTDGSIVLEFVDNEVYDGPGTDLLIFENAFLEDPGDDPRRGFFELAKVEVSRDGESWKEFPYDTIKRSGCAGHHPVFANPDLNEIDPTDPKQAGGDPFDLADVGLPSARFVRITDLSNTSGAEGTVGFDLDAIAAVHSRPRRP